MRLLLVLIICLPVWSWGQELSSIRTRWSDSFVEWDILAFDPEEGIQLDGDEAPPEAVVGELKLRWLNVREDFTEWDFELGSQRGTIRMPWKDNPGQWELRTYENEVITMRNSWSGDPTEWRITDNKYALQLGSKWKNQLDEWLVNDRAHGSFYLYTIYERDPRDWAIEDHLNSEISDAMKVALIFIAVYHSTPRQ